MSEQTIQPWDRQPGEGAKAFAAFAIYRDLPPAERSVDAVARRLGPKQQQSSGNRAAKRHHFGWSRRWQWVERAAAHDAHQDVQRRESLAEAIRKTQERHQLLARGVFSKLVAATPGVDFSRLTPTQFLGAVVQLVHLERLILGEPVSVERVQHTGPSGGPVRQVVAQSTFNPTPELVAEAMRILAVHGGLDPEPDVAPPGSPHPTPEATAPPIDRGHER
jgi:hypothetical protein